MGTNHATGYTCTFLNISIVIEKRSTSDIAQQISLMYMKCVGSHVCNNEKSHVAVTCLKFRSCAVSVNTPHTEESYVHKILYTRTFANAQAHL